MKTLILGISGQDGSYLAEQLLEKGYEVWGMLKRNSVAENQTARIQHIRPELNLEYGDMTDMGSIVRLLQFIQPEEIYNLAAQSHVQISFKQPLYTTQTIAIGTLNLLEAVRLVSSHSKVYQASSSEMFGNSVDKDGFQRETTPMNPASPYGISKLFAYNLVKNYRKSYNLFLTNGILFNHESPRRGSNFVTGKVAKEVAKIKFGLSDELRLGNLDASRDWGHAADYTKAMYQMLQLDEPDDFVCATGKSHTVRELCEVAFSYINKDYKKYVKIDPKYYRPEDIQVLKGDSSKLRNKINWEPEYDFRRLIEEMVEHWLVKIKETNGNI